MYDSSTEGASRGDTETRFDRGVDKVTGDVSSFSFPAFVCAFVWMGEFSVGGAGVDCRVATGVVTTEIGRGTDVGERGVRMFALGVVGEGMSMEVSVDASVFLLLFSFVLLLPTLRLMLIQVLLLPVFLQSILPGK